MRTTLPCTWQYAFAEFSPAFCDSVDVLANFDLLVLGFRDLVMSLDVVIQYLCVAMILCATGEARANVLVAATIVAIHDLQIGGPTKMEILPNP